MHRIGQAQLARRDHGHRAGALRRGIQARRRIPALDRLGGVHQPLARLDDAVVRGDEVLAGAVLDRSHAFLHGGILDADTEHAGKSLFCLLRRAVDQIVVAPVRDRDEGTFDQRHMDAAPGMGGFALGPGERPARVIVDAERPAALVIDRDERVAAAGIVPVGRKEAEARNQPLRDPPIVAVRPDIAARRDVEAGRRDRRDDFRVPVGEEHREA